METAKYRNGYSKTWNAHQTKTHYIIVI